MCKIFSEYIRYTIQKLNVNITVIRVLFYVRHKKKLKKIILLFYFVYFAEFV